jgi:drug/metabolite transporter (DMT)-like permease
MVQNSLGFSGPFTFVAWRFLLAGGVLAAIFPRALGRITRREWLGGAFTGMALGTGYILQTIGLQFTTTSKTGFITGMAVVIVPVLAFIALHQRPGLLTWTGGLVAAVGLGLLTLTERFTMGAGDLWVLGGAISFAFQIIGNDHFSDTDPVRLAIVQVGIVGPYATLAAFLFDQPTLILPLETWGAIAFTGVVATALVFSVQVAAQRYTSATQTAVIFALEPVFAAFFGWLLAAEVLGIRALIGCGLILAGMILSQVRGKVSGEPADSSP